MDSSFAPGAIVAGRWRITRKLGAMRLDETYAATDVATGESVALRVVRRDDGRDDATFRRFAKVARRLRAARHPNVQRVFGFATHDTRRGQARERVSFLVTEVLNGETLSHRVRREGPLQGDAADALIRDLGNGLEAIHSARVLHGDITGASVLFVAGGGGAPRAVLADLAFLTSGEGDDQAMARAVGSPAYRAPEQLTGGKLHRATDIFSLGAVIYEAVTGRLPFTGGNLLALDFRQLEEEPRRPSELAPGIEPARERAILRCLERSPADRFESATDLLRAMRGENVVTPRVRQAARTLGAASLLIAAMLGGSAVLSWVSVLEDRKLGVELAHRSRSSIAVMPIRADRLDARDRWIPIAAAELLRLELGRDDSLRVAPREAVSSACADLGLRASESVPPDALRHIRTMIGPEQLLIGSCRTTTRGSTTLVTLDLCVQDAQTGETVGAVFEVGSLSELPSLAARVATRIRPIIGAPPADRGLRAPKLEEWSTTGLEAYARGLAALDARKADEAVSVLRLAATTDADNPTVRLALSHAYWLSGDIARSIDEAKRAWDGAEGLSRERLLELELRYTELRGDPVRLIEAYRRMIRNYPDRVDHGFSMVDTLLRARNVDAAARALRSLQSAMTAIPDLRIALLQSRIETQRGRHQEALEAADEAASLASAISARGVFAEAAVEKAQILAALGEFDAASAALRRAKEAYRFRGELDEVARVTAIDASISQHSGRHEIALALQREAEQIYTSIGQRQGVAATRGSIALLLASRGRQRDATQQFASAVDGFVAIGDRPNAERSRIGMAGSLTAMGALSAAEAQLRVVLAAPPGDTDPILRGLALLGLARIESARGRVDRSSRQLDRATEQFERRGFVGWELEVGLARGTNSWLMGDEPAARRAFIAARRRAEERDNEVVACRAAVLLARVEITAGNATAALDSIGGCVARLKRLGSPADATMAKAVAAIAAIQLGDRTRAATLLRSSDIGTTVDEDFAAGAAAEIARELLRGEGTEQLMVLSEKAGMAPMPAVELDALLAAAEISARRGDLASRSATLDRASALATRLNLAGYARLVDAARAKAP